MSSQIINPVLMQATLMANIEKESKLQKIITCLSVAVALAAIAVIVEAYSCFPLPPMGMVIGGSAGLGFALIALSICGILRYRNKQISQQISQQVSPQAQDLSSANTSVTSISTTSMTPAPKSLTFENMEQIEKEKKRLAAQKKAEEAQAQARIQRELSLQKEEAERNLAVKKAENELNAFKQTDTYRNLPLAEVMNERGLPSPNDDIRRLLTHYNQELDVLEALLVKHGRDAWNQSTVIDHAVQLVKIAYWVSTETMNDLKNVQARHRANVSESVWKEERIRLRSIYNLDEPKEVESSYIVEQGASFLFSFNCVTKAYKYLKNCVDSVKELRKTNPKASKEFRDSFYIPHSKTSEARMLKNAFFCLVWRTYREEFYTGKLPEIMGTHERLAKGLLPDLPSL